MGGVQHVTALVAGSGYNHLARTGKRGEGEVRQRGAVMRTIMTAQTQVGYGRHTQAVGLVEHKFHTGYDVAIGKVGF